MKSPANAISLDHRQRKRSAGRRGRTHGLVYVATFEALEPKRLLSASKSTAVHNAHTNYTVFQTATLTAAITSSAAANPTGTGLTPAQVRHAFGVDQITFSGNVTGDGTGQTIAIVDAFDDPNIQSDLNTFDAAFGLPSITVTRMSQTGSTVNLPGTDSTGGWEGEESLDVEWAHAMAPGASIILVEANNANNSNLFQAVTTAKNQPGVVAVSMSFSGDEFSGETSDDSIFTSPANRGVTFLGATGDDGEPSGYPAFSPNVVAVGGTILSVPINGGANYSGNYTSEIGWPNPIISSATESGNTVTITLSSTTPANFGVGDSVTISGVSNSSYNGTFTIATSPSSTQFTYTLNTFTNLSAASGGNAIGDNNGGSGGSISTQESQPAYQSGIVTQSSTRRANPDVSLPALFQDSTGREYGVNVYDSFTGGGGWGEIGGTSLATPMWAGLIAIADQGRTLLGLGSLDGPTQTLPLLYQLPASYFHDITSGNNGFNAAAGYDLVTGLGSPLANLVIPSLVGATISGTVFDDVNGNGVQDSGEVGQAGVTVYDDVDDNGIFDPSGSASVTSTDVPKPIPDLTTITSTATVSGAGPITDVNVTLNITHTFDSDLVITLISPDGTQVTLASHDGGSRHNFTNTTFDDQATTSIANGRAPFTGSFKPIGSLATLNGLSANGTWTLQVADTVALDSGTLNSWSLQITGAGGDDIATTTDANGNYEFVNVGPGEHHIREVTPDTFIETAPVSGVNDVTVGPGETLMGLNFANTPPAPPTVLGDFNRNGVLEAGDISAAMTALTNLDEYMAAYNVTPEQLATFDDVNQDGQFTNADLQFLLHQLINGGGGSSSPAGHQLGSGPSSLVAATSQPVSSSAMTSEGFTDPRPVAAGTNVGNALPKTISSLRKLIGEDLADKPLGVRLRLLRLSGHISTYSALEKFFETWVA